MLIYIILVNICQVSLFESVVYDKFDVIIIYTDLNKKNNEISKLGWELFENLRKKVRLEPRYNGYFIVIDIDSGEYFLDKIESAAIAKAKEKLGEKDFFIHKCQFF